MAEPFSNRNPPTRRRSGAFGPVLVCAFGAFSASWPVLAQEAPEPAAGTSQEEITVSLSLVAPQGCGTESDLAGRISWRTNRVRFVPVGASERHLDVTVTVTERSATATLLLALPNGRRATRTLRASNCDEAIDAAALVAAVTLDPAASTAPAQPEPPDAGPEQPAGGTGGAPSVPPTPPKPPEAEDGDAPAAPAASPDDWSASLFVGGEVVVAPAPEPLLGFAVGALGVWERDSLVAPALRVGFAHYPGQRFDARGGTALFRLSALTVDACPFRLGNRTVRIFPCGSFTFGTLYAAGRQTRSPKDVNRRWTVAGGTLLGQWRPAEPFELTLFGTLGPPLVQDAFSFEPEVFHQVPAISGRAGIGLGWFFR